jgi:hypothetical protein
LHLSKLTQDLGNVSGFTYGGHTLLFFTMSVLLCYGFIAELKDNFNFIFFTPFVLFEAILFAQCNYAQKAADEVCCFI